MQLLIILLTFKINKSMNRKETLIWSNWKLFVEGQVIYDPDIKKMKLFNGEAWVNLDGTELA